MLRRLYHGVYSWKWTNLIRNDIRSHQQDSSACLYHKNDILRFVTIFFSLYILSTHDFLFFYSEL